jgi:2-methylcitrate dehydratase PrpD
VTAAEALGAFIARLRWENVPARVQAQVKLHVLDTLGVICAGVHAPETIAARTPFERWGGAEDAVVIGCNRRLPAPHAAFLNTFAGRVHTFDDTYEDGPVHPGSCAVGTALAVAQTANCSGADFLAATLAGYETTVRVSTALGPTHYGSGFHNTGTCNVFGACAAAARAFGLDADAIADALGLAGETAAGIRQYQVDGSMVDTALNGAHAARGGVTAVELRRAGLQGPHGILDGTWGIARVMSRNGNMGALADGLGETYIFEQTTMKPYPSCRFTHGPVEALLELRARHHLQAEAIESVEIATFRESMQVSDKPLVVSRVDAILSHQYVAARVLLDGAIGLADFDSERRAEPAARALSERVRVTFDPLLQEAYPDEWPHRITVVLRDGNRLVTESRKPPGGEHAAKKFRMLAEPVLGKDRAQQVIDAVERLDRSANVQELTCALA